MAMEMKDPISKTAKEADFITDNVEQINFTGEDLIGENVTGEDLICEDVTGEDQPKDPPLKSKHVQLDSSSSEGSSESSEICDLSYAESSVSDR